MPIRRPCIGCGQLISPPSSYCARCEHDRNVRRGSSSQRGYDRAWQAIRRTVLDRDRHRCQLRRPGCLGTATTVDHIQPLNAGGDRLNPANLQAACLPCNSGKRDRCQQPDITQQPTTPTEPSPGRGTAPNRTATRQPTSTRSRRQPIPSTSRTSAPSTTAGNTSSADPFTFA